MDARLPPLPASDPQSLRWNRKDNYYGVGSQEFWQDNEINQNEVKPFQQCEHYFNRSDEGVVCQRCHFGLIGNQIEIRDGKLFYNNDPIGL